MQRKSSQLTEKQLRERDTIWRTQQMRIALANKNNQQIREAWKYESTKQRSHIQAQS